LEIYRNLNHSLNITTHAIDIGMFTTMLWTFEEREKLINYIEGLTGTRFHAAFLLVGRLRYEIHLFFIDSLVYWLIHFIRKVREIHYILTSSRLWRTRLYEIGITEKDFCLFFGLTGIIARSSKINIDARFTGYEYYHSIDWSVFLASSGDSLDRYLLRMMSASPYPLVEILDRVCLLYSLKVTWAGLRSLKTGCILSVIVQGNSLDFELYERII
jgi:NADH-quinone oxidoreductase subunit D